MVSCWRWDHRDGVLVCPLRLSVASCPTCLTESVAPTNGPPRTRQQQMTRFGVMAAVLILGLAILQLQHGTLRTVGIAIGLPVIVILLVIAMRIVRGGRPS